MKCNHTEKENAIKLLHSIKEVSSKKVSFVKGFIIGIIVASFFFIVWLAGQSFKEIIKAQVHFDQAAEERIKGEFKITEPIENPYFYVDGFRDRTLFIAFSGKRTMLDGLVMRKTGMKIEELEREE